MRLENPYTVVYKQIHAVCGDKDDIVEILEHSNCYGGAAWSRFHYTRGPLVISSRVTGNWFRYLVKCGGADLELKSSKRSAGIESVLLKGDEVEITYAGLGGGGVGATATRAGAGDVIRSSVTEAGGGRVGRGTIVLPRRERLVIGVDDTDSKTEGATWSLVHNVASRVDRKEARYISHALVQLFPVPTKTQNCVSTAVEFACLPGQSDAMVKDFQTLLQRYTVSEDTGMVVFRGFDPSMLMPFAERCRSERVSYDLALSTAKEAGVEVLEGGQGLIGALAALPFCARPDESVRPGYVL